MLPQIVSPASCCGARQQLSPRRHRRGWEAIAGALSLSIWALVPKCPFCLAAHVALWTGLGLSLTAAMYLRWGLLAMSGAIALYLIVKHSARWLAAPCPATASVRRSRWFNTSSTAPADASRPSPNAS